MTVGGQFIPYTQVAEMIRQQWKKIGIDADVKETGAQPRLHQDRQRRAPDHVLDQ
ncbi:MAG: hypothetical protein M0C28_23915 [Candidatus Moduliflexus flocculans]|nr:hypothetical protein [Candidatus Moduliflexus flocculans]